MQHCRLNLRWHLQSNLYVGDAKQCIKLDYHSKYAMRYVHWQVENKGARYKYYE